MPATTLTTIGGAPAGYTGPNIYSASAAPTALNDSAHGSSVGDMVVLADGSTYLCTDATATAAKWALIGTASGPASVTISAAASTANICLVTFQVADEEGNAVAGVFHFDVTLSDASSGDGLTATAASGAVAAGASGADLIAMVAKKAIHVQTDATGKYILSITDAAKTLFYPCATIPGQGKLVVGTRLATNKYG
jgi:hypothetical protein